MKHHTKITFILVGVFFLSQILGLLIINQYIDYDALKETGKVSFSNLPYDVERPPIEESQSVWYISGAILIGTLLLLIIISLKKIMVWKYWYFLSVVVTLTVAFSAFFNQIIAVILAFSIGWWKVFRPHLLVHNLSEMLIYGGLAAIFVPIMNLFSAFMLLLIISIYDMYAVWKSKHMVKLAEFTQDSKVFAGLSIPYEKSSGKIEKNLSKNIPLGKETAGIKHAILGGGDIGFPLLFSGVVMKGLLISNVFHIAFLKVTIISAFTSLALYLLLLAGEKDKFYPAMPFLSMGCLLGYAIMLLF